MLCRADNALCSADPFVLNETIVEPSQAFEQRQSSRYQVYVAEHLLVVAPYRYNAIVEVLLAASLAFDVGINLNRNVPSVASL